MIIEMLPYLHFAAAVASILDLKKAFNFELDNIFQITSSVHFSIR